MTQRSSVNENGSGLPSGWARSVWGRLSSVQRRLRWAGFHRLMTDPSGRQFLEDLADYCNVRQASFVPNDPHATAFNEGQRDVYLHILELANLREHQLDLIMEASNQA